MTNQDKIICDDTVAHIATDMMQIQNIPKLQVDVALYKSKLSNELIIPNKLKK